MKDTEKGIYASMLVLRSEVLLRRVATEARTNLAHCFGFYNRERVHHSLDWRTPHEVYFATQEATGDPKIADAAGASWRITP